MGHWPWMIMMDSIIMDRWMSQGINQSWRIAHCVVVTALDHLSWVGLRLPCHLAETPHTPPCVLLPNKTVDASRGFERRKISWVCPTPARTTAATTGPTTTLVDGPSR